MDPDGDDAARLRRGDADGLTGLMQQAPGPPVPLPAAAHGRRGDGRGRVPAVVAAGDRAHRPLRRRAAFRAVALHRGPQPGARPAASGPAGEPGGSGRARGPGRDGRRPARARGGARSARLGSLDAVGTLAPSTARCCRCASTPSSSCRSSRRRSACPCRRPRPGSTGRSRGCEERLLAACAGGGVAMSAHVTELLPLAAAGALDAREQARLAAHLGECEACAREAAAWRRIADGLARARGARPSRALVARTVEAVERLLAERAERAWNRAALGFLVAFAWTLAVPVVGGDRSRGGGPGAAPRPPGGADGRVVRGLRVDWLAGGGCDGRARRPA